MIRLSVVVCTHNRPALLASCLQSLADQSLAGDQYEVIVVDNNSTGSTGEVIDRFAGRVKNFRSVVETDQGLSHARNRGWREALGEFVAFIDDDARAAPDWCERILGAFETVTPRPVLVGGRILPWYETPPPEWFVDELETREWGGTPRFLHGGNARYGFSGSNMAFAREVLDEYGGFSPAFGMEGGKRRVGEESELCFRIYADRPAFWYDPAIEVLHWVPVGHYRPGYHFMRGVQSGLAIKRMYGPGCGLRQRFMEGMDLLLFAAFRFPIALSTTRRNRRTEMVYLLKELGGKLGVFLG
ncbi:MAG: glycosyltransferase family 2 protein [bacterium]|nr:MAG: glycosyltransferase family 2 protein [bacterium]